MDSRPFAVLFAESVRCELAFQWLVVAWTALWLVSPWLARCRPPAAFALALMFAAAIGFGEYFGIYQNHGIGQPLTSYMAWVLAISTAVALTAISCRKTYRPGRFLLRLALWLIVAAIGCVIGEHILGSLWLPGAGRRPNLMASMPNLILLSLCTAAVLYVFNLPYLCLAFCVGPYRDRFQKVLRLSADSWRATTPLAAPTASDALMAGATGQILTPSTPQSTPPS